MSLEGYIYIYIYICGVHLGLLPQTSLGDTCLPYLSLLVLVRLLPRDDLGLYLSLSTSSTMPASSIPVGYVREICIMCLHVQLPKDMCTSFVFLLSDLYGVSCLHVQFL